jgi:hypothetical protein
MLPGLQHNNLPFDSFRKVDVLKAFFADIGIINSREIKPTDKMVENETT